MLNAAETGIQVTSGTQPLTLTGVYAQNPGHESLCRGV